MIRLLNALHARLVRRLPAPVRDEFDADIHRTYADRVSARAQRGGWFRGVAEALMGCLDTAGVVWRHRHGSQAGRRRGAARSPAAARDALKSLRRAPVWSLAIVALFALGIGSTTAAFTVVRGIIVTPLPYTHAHDLVRVGSVREGRPQLGSVSAPNFRDLQRATRTLQMVAASTPASMALPTPEGPTELVRGAFVSGEFFRLLGVAPMLGRILVTDDDHPAASRVVVISSRLWHERLGAQGEVIGQTLAIDGQPFTIVGVMAAGFQPPEGGHLRGTLLWVPLAHSPFPLEERSLAFLDVFGRLAPAASIDHSREELAGIGAGLADRHRLRARSFQTFTVESLMALTVGQAAPRLWLLAGVVTLLLVLTCASVAQLMGARASARERELAIRSALGAGDRYVRRYVHWLALWLAMAGAAVGVCWAAVSVRWVTSRGPVTLPRLAEISLDGMAIAFATGVALIVATLVSVWPASRATSGRLTSRLRSGGAGADGRARAGWLRDGLVGVQVAVGLMLLMCASVLAASLLKLEAVSPGFDPTNIVVVSIRLGDGRDEPAGPLEIAAFADLLERLRATAGVTHVSITTGAPFAGGGLTTYIQPTDRPSAETRGPDELRVGLHQVSGGHLTGLGVSFIRGRDLLPSDGIEAEPVVVTSRALADHYWPDQPVLDRSLIVGGDGSFTPRRVVGIVEAPRHDGRRVEDGWHVYVPFAQFPPAAVDLVVRTAARSTGMAQWRAAIHEAAPGASIRRVAHLDELMAVELVEPRFLAGTAGSFALVSVLLTCGGLFGTLAFEVERRRREIGIRRALGAAEAEVTRLVAGRSLIVVLAGVGIGIAGYAGVAGALDRFAYGMATTDPTMLVGVVVGQMLVAGVASWLPVRRAGRIEPLQAMRSE